MFASCIFRQEEDRLSKRNYDQKSLIILSHHEFPSLFLRLLRDLTAKSVVNDPDALIAACAQIAQWAPPSVGKHNLPFLGSILELHM